MKLIFKTVSVLVLTVGIFFTTTVHATAPLMGLKDATKLQEGTSPQDWIKYYADNYHASKSQTEQLLRVASCESSFNPKAYNPKDSDGLEAIGLFQYKQKTWNRFSGLIGEKLDIWNARDQAKLTTFIWVNYPQYKTQWGCFRSTLN